MARYYPHDYPKLDEDAINLRIDYGFFEYGIDVFELARYIGMTLIPYSSLSEEKRSAIKATNDLNDGFTVMRHSDGGWDFLTYYNDNLPLVRQRFTIAHEIKHVFYREENSTEKDEALADHFARELLAPSCLVMFLMENHSVSELCNFFNISVQATQNAVKSAKSRVKGKGKQLNQYEAEYIDYMKSNKIISRKN